MELAQTFETVVGIPLLLRLLGDFITTVIYHVPEHGSRSHPDKVKEDAAAPTQR